MTTKHVLLRGIVGSHAYGLNTETSDIDRLGVFAYPTERFHGLHLPIGKRATDADNGPGSDDITLHEALKYATLGLQCNPTTTELLWLPDELYEVRTDLGSELLSIRSSFLTAKRVRDAYFGYATEQFGRLKRRGDGSFSADTRKRTSKHSRHLRRLLWQGLHVYTTGVLPVRLDRPEEFHAFGKRVAKRAAKTRYEDVTRTMQIYERAFDEAKTPLPDRADEDRVEKWLLSVRRRYLD